MNPFASFLVGLLASVSTCLAVVGGLVISLSAKMSQEGMANGAEGARTNRTTIALFHAGRLVAFALLGGVLGIVGGALGAASLTFGAILGIVASVAMLLLGASLIGILPKSGIMLPSWIFDRLTAASHRSSAPFLLGAATFFLPCGFTQSMQAVALASGSFLSGMLVMLFFALGTLPMLLALSFGSASIAKSRHAPALFKAVGGIVIALGIYSLLGGLAGLGVIDPVFEAGTERGAPSVSNVEIRDGIQYVTIRAGRGYFPKTTVAQGGIPTKLLVETKNTFDCSAALVVPAAGYRAMLPQTGQETIDIGVPASGTSIDGTCSMGMYGFVVRFE